MKEAQLLKQGQHGGLEHAAVTFFSATLNGNLHRLRTTPKKRADQRWEQQASLNAEPEPQEKPGKDIEPIGGLQDLAADRRDPRRIDAQLAQDHLGDACMALIEEMERAVQECRRTLAVLTPGYLADGFSALENIMAQHHGRERGEPRLVAILREPCTPQLRLRVSPPLDMVDEEQVAEILPHLIAGLRGVLKN